MNNPRNPVLLVLIVLAALILIGSTVAIVPETKQAVIVRFGEPVRIINRYKPNEAFGHTGAGVALHAKPTVAAQCDIRINHGDLTALLYVQGYAAEDFA